MGEDMSAFHRITVIGLGLIGSSVVRAVRKYGVIQEIIGVDISEEVCEVVRGLGLVDRLGRDVEEGVKDTDMIMLCTPLSTYGDLALRICPLVKQGTIITDVGSVKKYVIDCFKRYYKGSGVVVPGHPVAGTEFSGPQAGYAELFQGRWCILTPDDAFSDRVSVDRVRRFWEDLGCHVAMMDALHHDTVLALMSHLPHLIAYTIVGTASDLEQGRNAEILKFAAGGFRDFTRIAASHPGMWRDIFLYNKEAVLEMLQCFNEDLTRLQRAIRWGEGEMLHKYFTRTRGIRQKLIEIGQE